MEENKMILSQRIVDNDITMSSTVRKYTNSRMVSVAPLDYALEKTKMEYGSINPIGLPEDWKLFIDPKLLEVERIICGSGLQNQKFHYQVNIY